MDEFTNVYYTQAMTMVSTELTFSQTFQNPLKKCEVHDIIIPSVLQGSYKSVLLAETIKVTRQKAFMSQEEFAAELKVSVSTINRWETGKVKPNLTAMKSLKRFCGEYDLSYEDIENEWFNHSLGKDNG